MKALGSISDHWGRPGEPSYFLPLSQSLLARGAARGREARRERRAGAAARRGQGQRRREGRAGQAHARGGTRVRGLDRVDFPTIAKYMYY